MNGEFPKLKEVLKWPGLLILLMWGIFLLEWLAEVNLGSYGIRPRLLSGLPGIFFSPLLHGDWEHLISNTFPILALGALLFYFFRSIALEVFGWLWLFSGFWLWSFGREGTTHIGASGLIYALAFFLISSGFIRRNRAITVISFIVIFLYGSLVWGVFPVQPGISWDGHLMGLISGLVLAFLFRKKGPENDPPKEWDDSDLDGAERYWELPDGESELPLDEGAKPVRFRYIYKKNPGNAPGDSQ